MKTSGIIFLIFLSFSIKAQELSLKELIAFQNEKFEKINDVLLSKKWEFEYFDKSNVKWNHTKDRESILPKVDSKLIIVFDTSFHNSINYYISQERFIFIKNEAKKQGFQYFKNEIIDEKINSVFKKGDLFIKFNNQPISGNNAFELNNFYSIEIYDFKSPRLSKQDLSNNSKLGNPNGELKDTVRKKNNENTKPSIKYTPKLIFNTSFSVIIHYKIDINKTFEIVSIDPPYPFEEIQQIKKDFLTSAEIINFSSIVEPVLGSIKLTFISK